MIKLWKDSGSSKRFIYILSFSVFFVFFLSYLFGIRTNQLITSPREYALMKHYLSATVTSYRTFGPQKTKQWLCALIQYDGLNIFFINETGEIISCNKPNDLILGFKDKIMRDKIKFKIMKKNGYMVVHHNINNDNYWLISSSNKISWVHDYKHPIAYRLLLALVLSILISIVLSWFISIPIMKIRNAFQYISKGKFNVRLNKKTKLSLKEFGELNNDFNHMGKSIENFIDLKDSVLETISHELKSPLARQRAAINILEDDAHESHIKHIKRISIENKKITEIIHDTLDYIKLHRQNSGLKYSNFDMIEIINETIDNVFFEFNYSRFELISPEKCLLKGDKSLIKIVLSNILVNAAKHSPKDGLITITINEEEHLMKLTVSDNGPGVEATNIDRIFEPYMTNSLTSEKNRSHGLGLAISKKIVSLHKGTITAKNKVSGGLIMTIILPRHTAITKH